MRGFFSGVVWGLVLAGLGVALLSVLSPVAPAPDVALQAPSSGSTGPEEEPAASVDVAPRDSDVVEVAPGSTVGETPEPGDLNKVDDSDTDPGSQPDVAVVKETLQNPTEPGTSPEVETAEANKPAELSKPLAEAPAVPDAESDIAAETDAPTPPDAAESNGSAEQIQNNTTAETSAPQIATSSDDAPAASAPAVIASDPVADAVPQASTDPAPLPETRAEPEPEISVQAKVDVPVAPDVEPEPQIAPGPVSTPAPEPETPVTADDDSGSTGQRAQIAALPQAGTSTEELRPTVGKRVRPLTERNIEVAAAAPEPGTEDKSDLPPLQRYAAPFENPENKPLMSIVLIDDEGSIGVEALQEFPYPLSFAIDPAAPDAADKMARHRAAGFEVVALVNLSAAATAQDAEVSLTAGFDTLKQAVGILEGTGSGVQGNRDLSGQVADFAKSTGRGLVMQDSGLNTAYKLALRDGVPVAVVFRDFDGAGQNPTVMRRFLDQAAFRAGQDGGVIMMGRVRPDTISALLLWGLQDRASRVALSPVSAVLTRTPSN